MEYNAISRELALLEDSILNHKVDHFLTRDQILTVLKNLQGPNNTNSVLDDIQLADLIIETIKSEEFRSVLNTIEFQDIYNYIGSLPPALNGGIEEFFTLYLLHYVGATQAWKDFINLESLKQISNRYELISLAERLLLSNLMAPTSHQNALKYYRIRPKEKTDRIYQYYLIQPDDELEVSIDFKICDKTFSFQLKHFSEENIRTHLKRYLIADDNKNEIIRDTVQFSRELIATNFIAENEPWFVLHCLTSLYDFIFEKECALFNYIFRLRIENSRVYQSLVERDPSLCFAPEELFLFYIIAGSSEKDLRNFYNNNYAAIWRSYINTSSTEKRQQNPAGIVERLREKLAKSLFPAESLNLPPAPAADACPNKQKFPYKKNLLGALAWKKAEKTGRPYIDIFREAAEEWLDEDGNEITGEQLANNFYNSAKNHGGPQYFYDAKEKQLTIIKKKIKWKD